MLKHSTIEKAAPFCQVEQEQVVTVHDVSSVYHVPMVLSGQGLDRSLAKILKLDDMKIPRKSRSARYKELAILEASYNDTDSREDRDYCSGRQGRNNPNTKPCKGGPAIDATWKRTNSNERRRECELR